VRKYIFVIGGVLSSLGKGVITSSLGNILKNSGYKIVIKKFDPYLNVDSGTMNPYQHGEVYITFDGGETDLDLGHYERFIGKNLRKEFCVTSGQIYQKVIEDERNHKYLGKTIQIIPDITNLIKQHITYLPEEEKDTEIIIVEIGGTVGDIESAVFIEAIRQLKISARDDVLIIYLTLVMRLNVNGEIKTKPTQHALRLLLSLGIQPDILICRETLPLSKEVIEKLSLFSNLPINRIYSAPDCKQSIYEMPSLLQNQQIMDSINECLKLSPINLKLQSTNELSQNLTNFLTKINQATRSLVIFIIGKYTNVPDAYLSISESIKFASYQKGFNPIIKLINSEEVTEDNVNFILKGADGILVPGGFGKRGISGKILAIKYARLNKIPYFGICFGMQLMCIEFAQNACNLLNANSQEIDPNTNTLLFTI